MKKVEKFPEKEKYELAHKSAKAVISVIPGAGGPINEFFEYVIKSPLEKRRIKWLNDLAEAVMELQEKVDGFSIGNLSEDELFLSTILLATDIAIKNHQEEKILALKAAIQNTAIKNTPEEDVHMILMYYIDTLTPWHLRILKFFKNPRKWGEMHGIEYPNWMSASPSHALEHAFSELSGKRDIYDKLVSDLYNYGLINLTKTALYTGMTEAGILASRTTVLGNQFIELISSPLTE